MNRVKPNTVNSFAHGRVNLIGEHTDYNGGFVLPTAIPQKTEIMLTPRPDMRVYGSSTNVDVKDAKFVYEIGKEARSGHWWDYVQGVTAALMKEESLAGRIRGFNLDISSTVPLGSGLSSSAALEVALLRAIRKAFEMVLDLDDVLIAKLGQHAENHFVGAHVGIMDQMACSLADSGTALFLDTQAMTYRKIDLPRASLIVINSGISHRHDGGDYNARRKECEVACAELGIKELRDIGVSEITSERFNALPEILRKRAKHVITENQRVLDAVVAIESRDLKKLGELFKESHLSMKDDYDVSIPEIDWLVEIANRQKHIYGARLTGGGFGGSIVALCESGEGQKTAEAIVAEYEEKTGEKATILCS